VIEEKYNNIPGVEYLDISYDLYEGAGDKKKKVGLKTCRFVQTKEKGVLPRILMKLLKQRKETRKKIEFQTVKFQDGSEISGLYSESGTGNGDGGGGGGVIIIKGCDGKIIGEYPKDTMVSKDQTYNEFQQAVLDGLQLAYKVTANSLYGQCGAKTSPIYMKEVAASTTATGRNMIMKAKGFIEDNYDAEIIYGDTDSLFVKFNNRDAEGGLLKGKEALKPSIHTACEVSKEFRKTIKAPHDLEYEKTFWPFILLSKKRYIANKYEFDIDHYKQSSMGVVLRRRDNANIVKTIYGGIIDIILNETNIGKSIEFLNDSLQKMITGQYPLEEFIISKSLKSDYKDPTRISHKVLADRMKERDPGSAPQVNDRLPYAYIQVDPTKFKKGATILQGDRIEHPTYIRENKLKLDYEFYLTNQLMNPILQIYALILEDLTGYKKGREYFTELYDKILVDKENDVTKAKTRLQDLRDLEVKKLLFDPFIIKLQNKRLGNREITDFFKVMK